MGPTRYFVLNESTLCCAISGLPGWFTVLAGSVWRYGRDWRNGPAVYGPLDVIRPATLADFHEYRINPRGYFPAPQPTEEKQ